jgi:hypothetical protein
MAIICNDLPLPGKILKKTSLSVSKWKDGTLDTKVQLTFDDDSFIVYEFSNSYTILNSLGITNPETGEYIFDSEGNYVFKADYFDEDQYQCKNI